jgi:hypothetical protein
MFGYSGNFSAQYAGGGHAGVVVFVVVHYGLLLITLGLRPIPTSKDGPNEV